MTLAATSLTDTLHFGSGVTKRENGEDFPAAAYAYVPDPSNPSTWKLRLWETLETKTTAAQVGRAIAALGAGFRGSRVQIPSDALGRVKARVLSAWVSTHKGADTSKAPSVLKHCMEVEGAQKFGMGSGLPPLMQDEDGHYVAQGIRIFKTGGFKDSRGRFSRWDAGKLEQTAENFHALKEAGILPNVPARSDHSSSIDKVVAYLDNTYTDGEYLYADIQFTQPDAVQKYANGTYRNVSVEIGPYEMNDGQEIFPVCMGFAFVDLPAVEGLYNHPGSESSRFTFTEESPVKFRIKGVETEDFAAVQARIDELEAEAGKPATHEFRIGGETVTDFAKVQARIDALETFQAEQVLAARDGFVDTLVAAKKVAAPQAEALKTFGRSLDTAAFDAWKATFDAALPIPALTQHAASGNGLAAPATGDDPVADRIAVLEHVVKMSRDAGMTEADIAKQPSHIELTQLKAQRAAA